MMRHGGIISCQVPVYPRGLVPGWMERGSPRGQEGHVSCLPWGASAGPPMPSPVSGGSLFTGSARAPQRLLRELPTWSAASWAALPAAPRPPTLAPPLGGAWAPCPGGPPFLSLPCPRRPQSPAVPFAVCWPCGQRLLQEALVAAFPPRAPALPQAPAEGFAEVQVGALSGVTSASRLELRASVCVW